MEELFTEKIIKIKDIEYIRSLFGNFDENIKIVEKNYGVTVTSHGGEVKIKGDDESCVNASETVNGLLALIEKGENITEQNINYIMGLVDDGASAQIKDLRDMECITVTRSGKPVKPKTLGQQKYIDAIRKNTITIGVGPAGTGKTYLAVAMAVTDRKSVV